MELLRSVRSRALCLAALALAAGSLSVLRGARAERTAPPLLPAVKSGVPEAPLPARLSSTGLYAADSVDAIAPDVMFYVPQYPLWSDGAKKRRWIRLPQGARIDATNADAWAFPPGTRFWKEFSFGARVETRYMERLRDGSYRYATYVWDAEQRDAFLAPEKGLNDVKPLGARASHDIPSNADCRACHEGRHSQVLGFNALQLSPDRDPMAPHRELATSDAVDLPELSRRGLIQGLAPALLARPPRIEAPSKVARAAAGYLFANCAHCHNAESPLAVLGLDFDQSVLDSAGGFHLFERLAGRATHFRLTNEQSSVALAPGHPEKSAILARAASRNAAQQMPPLGTELVDTEGTELLQRWITQSSFSKDRKENEP
ncbi:MAG TPA: hypothetical protein VFQ35_18135 [Polyangiaceae bacterium]|nr:hypothetical protein [Polyangiaceae bacterium]